MALLIFKILAVQVAVISVIVFILKKILDRQLIESALHDIEILDGRRTDADISELTVVAYEDLNPQSQKRILDAMQKKINRTVHLVVTKDKTLKGGMIIRFKGHSFDYSLVNRLKESGLIK